MADFQRVHSIGTGESYTRVSRTEILRLTNAPIDMETAKLFLIANQIPCKITFSNRKCKMQWGTAWRKDKRIVLYRHCVWTFLHEVAHTIADPGIHHGPQFGLILSALYLKWREVEK